MSGPMNFVIRAADADEAIRKAIVAPLVAYNEMKTGRSDPRPVVFAVEDDDGHVVGGLWGRTAFEWLFVELLFVPEALRGRGVGTDLMRRAEAEAIARGCRNAWLDTFEFQARGFYERLGYTCFAELDRYPGQWARFFMRKPLGRP
jgi:GNAT superfamily N-acetyltransferase